MPLDPVALPLLLAGPILRRVESDLVSVWIATSRACNVSVLLYVGGDVIASEDANDDLRARWVSDLQPALQIGANLHVLTAVLDLRTPGGNAVRTSGTTLVPDQTYSYDLQIFERANPAQRQTLRTLGLLTGPTPLGYDPDELPSFRACPQELDRLVIVHGSCRHLFTVPPVEDDPTLEDDPFEPPGGWPRKEPTPESPAHTGEPDPFPGDQYPQLPKRDGMLWVDTLNEALGPSRIADRPHQLILTGDQIYADQAPAAVLPALNKLARVLIGEEDLGADPTGAQFKRATLENFPPAFRADIVRRSAAFTTSAGDSHLLSFGEFVAYYLLTWSPALWTIAADEEEEDDSDALDPSIVALWPEDFNPAQIAMPEDWRVRFIYEDDSGVGDTTEYYDMLVEALPVADSPQPEASRDEHASWYFEQRRDFLASKYWSPALLEWWTRRFRNGLARVRRALANVPTYMVADDHEISDDWYFSRQWREQVFTRPLGVDIIRNGLIACSVMQSWGNDPRRWAAGPERELLESANAYSRAMAASAAANGTLPRASLDRIHELLGLPQSAGATPPTFRPLVEYSFAVEGPCHRVLAIDGRTKRRFPTRTSPAGGIDYEGASGLIDGDLPTGLPGEGVTGLFGDSPMAAALPPRPDGDTKLTIVVTGVPVIGPEGMEQVLVPFQRFARLLLDVDAEAWSYEPATYEALLAALARYRSVVILSGDVHVGWSAALDYWSAPDGEAISTARIVQLVSSGLTKDWGGLSPPLRNHALTLDVFEAATNTALLHSERIGWGTPLRTSLVPPPARATLVTNAERAHPFYRARLKMQAPVVPTHGWPAGTTEAREPNWAWRASMARDDRVESTSPPNMQLRWSPVLLPENPVDPSGIGWHARAARRMAFGRVFAVNTNIGIVTFEPDGTDWTVQHVLAGELPPLAETGAVPTGLQPYIVHRFTLAPVTPATWTDARPKLADDGGWGADATEPVLSLFVDLLPRVWGAAAGFTGAVWEGVPPVLDGVTREALITDAAERAKAPFRRRVVGELGPFATLPDEDLDAVTSEAIAALLPAVGRLDVDREARALVRPDLERMLAFHQSLADPAAVIDDLLLLGCSEWVNERARLVTIVAGILVTFRSPVTKHVPVTARLLSGLWDLWRNRTLAETFTNGSLPASVAGLLSAIPRAAVFALELFEELLVNIIQDRDPRPEGEPPIFTPELTLAGLGVALGLNLPYRFTFVSGWEPRAAPLAPGTRLGVRTPEALARQTLSMMLHPGERARFAPPAQKLSVTMLPPPGPNEEPPSEEDPNLSSEQPSPGSLLIGWDGGLETEEELGAGFRLRLELDGRGTHELLWSGIQAPKGRLGGASARATLLRPTRLDIPGLQIRLTPAVSMTVGVKGGPEEGSLEPAFTLRVALNDVEDRVTFVPDDAFVTQLLPTDGIALPLDAAIQWSIGKGWHLTGFAEVAGGTLVNPPAAPVDPPRDPNADFDEPPPRSPLGPLAEVVTPMNRRLGVLSIHERRLEVATAADDESVALALAVTATVSTNIGPVRLAFSGLGVRGKLLLRNTYEEDDDLVDFSIEVPTPTGVAVSIDATAVAGGGFIQRIERADGGVTWRGGLALRIGERIEAGAFAVVEVGGGRHWSLIAMLFVHFSPPVHLTVGLKLVAVGGLLALHRTMDVDALRDAATGTQGTLDAFMLPARPEERFLELLPAVERFFPPAAGHQVVGLLAQIEWRAETGTKFGEFRLALLGELETLQFALYGTARLGFPRIEDPHILRVRAAAEALYDHRGKFARFSLTLVEAFLFERVHLTGGCALLLRWGDRDEFAFTLGGFHPSFRPFIPKELREPPRLGASWKPHSLLELSIQAYFALTCTSLQFGFAAHLKAGASWGGIRGDAEFNFLVMTEPDCRFELDLSFRVTAFLFGADLISASFSGSITGPGPWSCSGSIYWEVCGVTLSKDLGPYEWGDSPGQLATQQQEARQVLGDGFADAANWTIRRSPLMPVRLRPGTEEAIDARDQIDVRQTRLPLGVPIEVHDANGLRDPGIWSLRPDGRLRKVADLTDVFPTRRYLQRPPAEAPFRGGLVCGVRVAGSGWTFDPARAVGSDEEATEDLVLDSLPQPPRRVTGAVRVALLDALLVAAPSQAPERRWTRHLVKLEAMS